MNQMPTVSESYMSFARNAGEPYQIWMDAVQKLSKASQLEHKTAALAYIAVLAVMRLESGLPFHVKHAKMLGASREEIISAILVGLPAAGNIVTQSIPVAVQAYDEND